MANAPHEDEALTLAADEGRLDEWIAADLKRRYDELMEEECNRRFLTGDDTGRPRGLLGG